MKSRILTMLLVGVILLSFVSTVLAQEQILIKLGNVSAIGDLSDDAARKFAEEVNTRSDGKIKIEVYSAGQLGGDRDLLEGMQIGTVEMGIIGIGLLAIYDPLANLFVMPYMIKSTEHSERVWGGEIGEEIFASIREKTGIRVLPYLVHRSPRYLTVNKPVYKPEDLKGVKIRVPEDPISVATWKAFGANPTALAASEIYSALQQGVIDAQENPLDSIYNRGIHQIVDYLVLTAHLRNEDYGFMIAEEIWQSLSEDLQSLILEVAKEIQEWAYIELLAKENLLLGKIVFEGKMNVIYPDIEAFEKLAAEVPKAYPEIMDYYNRIVAME